MAKLTDHFNYMKFTPAGEEFIKNHTVDQLASYIILHGELENDREDGEIIAEYVHVHVKGRKSEFVSGYFYDVRKDEHFKRHEFLITTESKWSKAGRIFMLAGSYDDEIVD